MILHRTFLGTGKTLCLLCATLGWMEHKKVEINRETEETQGAESAKKAKMQKLIYASRTHSQLAQGNYGTNVIA